MKRSLMILLLFIHVKCFAQNPLLMKINNDTVFYNSDASNTLNLIRVEIQNLTEKPIIIPLDFETFNFISKEFNPYEIMDLFNNQEFIYPWINLTNDKSDTVYIQSVLKKPDLSNPYLKNSIIKDNKFYERAFKYSILKNGQIKPKEKIDILFPISFPLIYSSADIDYSFDLTNGCNYNISFEIYIDQENYEKYLKNFEIAKYKDKGIEFFTGIIKTNQIKLINTAEKCRK